MILETLKQDISTSRQLLYMMLEKINEQLICINNEKSTVQLWNEKDSILSAHSRIIQLIVKLGESELRFEHEALKLAKMKRDFENERSESNDESEELLPPLAQEEWDALFHAFERHNQKEQSVEQLETDANYAVLLK